MSGRVEGEAESVRRLKGSNRHKSRRTSLRVDGGGDQGGIRDADSVVDLVLGLETSKDRDR
jgi:hypothetical protein